MLSADLELFHHTNTNEYVSEFLWDNEEIPIAMSRDILEKVEHCFTNEARGLWKIVLKGTNAYVGYVGLWSLFEESQPQLLYAIYKQYSGFGYGSEAAQEIVNYAIDSLGYEYLIASMDVGNTNSIKLCQRIGFEFNEERIVEGKPTYFYKFQNKA